jgi:hypothetical protein
MTASLIGRRIRLVASMEDEPDPVPLFTTGTVTFVSHLPGFTQIGVEWDNGRTMMLCVPPDRYEMLAEEERP